MRAFRKNLIAKQERQLTLFRAGMLLIVYRNNMGVGIEVNPHDLLVDDDGNVRTEQSKLSRFEDSGLELEFAHTNGV
jgi:hypothetical protein